MSNTPKEQKPQSKGNLTVKLVATCSYCGSEFASHQEIQQHIEVCPKAPTTSTPQSNKEQ